MAQAVEHLSWLLLCQTSPPAYTALRESCTCPQVLEMLLHLGTCLLPPSTHFQYVWKLGMGGKLLVPAAELLAFSLAGNGLHPLCACLWTLGMRLHLARLFLNLSACH